MGALVNHGLQHATGPYRWRLAVSDGSASVALAAATPSDDDGVMTPEEHSIAQAFKASRRAAFATGRGLARDAMAELGCAPASILRTSDGAPVWPVDCLGSISHSRQWVVAVVAPSQTFLGLGIDIEQQCRVREHLFRRVLTARERAELNGVPAADRSERATWIFSAKEAVYKAVYPTLRRYIGFEAVEVQISCAQGSDTNRPRVTAQDGKATLGALGDISFRYVGSDADCALVDSAIGRLLRFGDQVIGVVVLPLLEQRL